MNPDPDRPALLRRHAALAANLRRLGATPLLDDDAAEALEVDQLAAGVVAEGDYLARLARALGGTS